MDYSVPAEEPVKRMAAVAARRSFARLSQRSSAKLERKCSSPEEASLERASLEVAFLEQTSVEFSKVRRGGRLPKKCFMSKRVMAALRNGCSPGDRILCGDVLPFVGGTPLASVDGSARTSFESTPGSSVGGTPEPARVPETETLSVGEGISEVLNATLSSLKKTLDGHSCPPRVWWEEAVKARGGIGGAPGDDNASQLPVRSVCKGKMRTAMEAPAVAAARPEPLVAGTPPLESLCSLKVEAAMLALKEMLVCHQSSERCGGTTGSAGEPQEGAGVLSAAVVALKQMLACHKASVPRGGVVIADVSPSVTSPRAETSKLRLVRKSKGASTPEVLLSLPGGSALAERLEPSCAPGRVELAVQSTPTKEETRRTKRSLPAARRRPTQKRRFSFGDKRFKRWKTRATEEKPQGAADTQAVQPSPLSQGPAASFLDWVLTRKSEADQPKDTGASEEKPQGTADTQPVQPSPLSQWPAASCLDRLLKRRSEANQRKETQATYSIGCNSRRADVVVSGDQSRLRSPKRTTETSSAESAIGKKRKAESFEPPSDAIIVQRGAGNRKKTVAQPDISTVPRKQPGRPALNWGVVNTDASPMTSTVSASHGMPKRPRWQGAQQDAANSGSKGLVYEMKDKLRNVLSPALAASSSGVAPSDAVPRLGAPSDAPSPAATTTVFPTTPEMAHPPVTGPATSKRKKIRVLGVRPLAPPPAVVATPPRGKRQMKVRGVANPPVGVRAIRLRRTVSPTPQPRELTPSKSKPPVLTHFLATPPVLSSPTARPPVLSPSIAAPPAAAVRTASKAVGSPAVKGGSQCPSCWQHGVPRDAHGACSLAQCRCWCCRPRSPYPRLLARHGVDKRCAVRLEPLQLPLAARPRIARLGRNVARKRTGGLLRRLPLRPTPPLCRDGEVPLVLASEPPPGLECVTGVAVSAPYMSSPPRCEPSPDDDIDVLHGRPGSPTFKKACVRQLQEDGIIVYRGRPGSSTSPPRPVTPVRCAIPETPRTGRTPSNCVSSSSPGTSTTPGTPTSPGFPVVTPGTPVPVGPLVEAPATPTSPGMPVLSPGSAATPSMPLGTGSDAATPRSPPGMPPLSRVLGAVSAPYMSSPPRCEPSPDDDIDVLHGRPGFPTFKKACVRQLQEDGIIVYRGRPGSSTSPPRPVTPVRCAIPETPRTGRTPSNCVSSSSPGTSTTPGTPTSPGFPVVTPGTPVPVGPLVEAPATPTSSESEPDVVGGFDDDYTPSDANPSDSEDDSANRTVGRIATEATVSPAATSVPAPVTAPARVATPALTRVSAPAPFPTAARLATPAPATVTALAVTPVLMRVSTPAPLTSAARVATPAPDTAPARVGTLVFMPLSTPASFTTVERLATPAPVTAPARVATPALTRVSAPAPFPTAARLATPAPATVTAPAATPVLMRVSTPAPLTSAARVATPAPDTAPARVGTLVFMRLSTPASFTTVARLATPAPVTVPARAATPFLVRVSTPAPLTTAARVATVTAPLRITTPALLTAPARVATPALTQVSTPAPVITTARVAPAAVTASARIATPARVTTPVPVIAPAPIVLFTASDYSSRSATSSPLPVIVSVSGAVDDCTAGPSTQDNPVDTGFILCKEETIDEDVQPGTSLVSYMCDDLLSDDPLAAPSSGPSEDASRDGGVKSEGRPVRSPKGVAESSDEDHTCVWCGEQFRTAAEVEEHSVSHAEPDIDDHLEVESMAESLFAPKEGKRNKKSSKISTKSPPKPPQTDPNTVAVTRQVLVRVAGEGMRTVTVMSMELAPGKPTQKDPTLRPQQVLQQQQQQHQQQQQQQQQQQEQQQQQQKQRQEQDADDEEVVMEDLVDCEPSIEAAVGMALGERFTWVPGEELVCSECQSGYETREQLARHRMARHVVETWHRCKEPGCPDAFHSELRLRAHIAKEHVSLKYTCNRCRARLPSALLLAAHRVVEHGLNNALICPLCPKDAPKHEATFQQPDELTTHLRVKHPGSSPLRCAVCGLFSHNVSAMLQHHKEHVAEQLRLHCPCCVAWFSTRELLLAHVRFAHAQGSQFVCPGCGFAASSADALALHVKTLHRGATPYKCAGCKMRFRTLVALRAHAQQSLHYVAPTGKKPVFTCKTCCIESHDPIRISEHRESVHMKLLPLDRIAQLVSLMQDSKVVYDVTRAAAEAARKSGGA